MLFGMENQTESPQALRQMSDSDLEFIQRLVLTSGSLKDLAGQYGVSYPTIRGRLDKVIERLRGLVEGRPPDPMADLLADLIGRGELAPAAARNILELHRKLSRKSTKG
jgi:hypothetical protein